MQVEKPWGRWELITQGKNFLIKKIYVKPFEELSLQYHNERSEFWFATKGKFQVKLDIDGNGKLYKVFDINEGQNVYIQKRQHHQIINNTDEEIIIIEIQMGRPDEEDIVRLEDKYDRHKL